MIYLMNMNDTDAAALNRACKERGVKTSAMLSAIAREGCRALVEERRISLDNILNPVGLAADLVRSVMTEDEFADFCASETTIDDMEDNFKNNCIDLVNNPDPEAEAARKLIASLFLGDVDLTSIKPNGTKPKVVTQTAEELPEYVEQMREILSYSKTPMTFKELSASFKQLPSQAAIVFSKAVAKGMVAGVAVSKNESKTNVYTFEG